MKSVARGERAPRLKEPPLTDGTWKLIQDCWMQEKTTRPSIEDIVERMIRQEDRTKMSELIGNKLKISSTPAERISFLVQSTHPLESPKGRRITRMRSLTSKKPYDRPEAVIPEHDLRNAPFASSSCIDLFLSFFNGDSEAVMRELRQKKAQQCSFPGCLAHFTSSTNLTGMSSVLIMNLTLTNIEQRRSLQLISFTSHSVFYLTNALMHPKVAPTLQQRQTPYRKLPIP